MIGVNMDFAADVNWKDAKRDKYFVLTQYLDSIYEAGGIPVPIPCLKNGKALSSYIDIIDGFIFVGGADYPPESYDEVKSSESLAIMVKRRYENDLALASSVMDRHIPILGICAGVQLLNIIAGGKLIQDIDSSATHTKGAKHKIEISGGKILKSLFGEIKMEVNSFHHQAIDPHHVGRGFEVTALSEDGILEAVESSSERFILGVQWHPERMGCSHRNRIFRAFIKACKESVKSLRSV